MWIDERFVFVHSKSVSEMVARKRGAWNRRAVLRALWSLRTKIADEQGLDIFNVLPNDGGFEFTLKGEIDASPISDDRRAVIHGNRRATARRRMKNMKNKF